MALAVVRVVLAVQVVALVALPHVGPDDAAKEVSQFTKNKSLSVGLNIWLRGFYFFCICQNSLKKIHQGSNHPYLRREHQRHCHNLRAGSLQQKTRLKLKT